MANALKLGNHDSVPGDDRNVSANHAPEFVVALAASAGGIPAVSRVLESLPRDFPGSVMVLVHLSPRHESRLSEVLRLRTKLRVETARDGRHLRRGTVFVAPPDRHV